MIKTTKALKESNMKIFMAEKLKKKYWSIAMKIHVDLWRHFTQSLGKNMNQDEIKIMIVKWKLQGKKRNTKMFIPLCGEVRRLTISNMMDIVRNEI